MAVYSCRFRSRKQKSDLIVCQVRAKPNNSLRPKDPTKAPVVGAILIALAQLKRKAKPTQQDFNVSLLAAPDTHKLSVDRLLLYKASITAALLDRFDNPIKAFESEPVVISCHEIPLTVTGTGIRRIHDVIASALLED